jgi:cardiolipin synthase
MKRFLVFLLVLLSVPNVRAATVETFVSPDSSFSTVSGFIDGAEDTIFLATYTFSSPEITAALVGKRSEGVGVQVLVEKSPAGGVSEHETTALCALLYYNISVFLYDGPLRYMHAKYVVRDNDSVLVTSENFGYSGFMPGGEYGNRGWGVIVHDHALSRELYGIYLQDLAESRAFVCPPGNYRLESWETAGAYAPEFGKETFTGQSVKLIYSPDSLDEILGLIGSASSSVLVDEFYIYAHWGSASRDNVSTAPSPVLEALLDKARQGVPVKILLDSTYYEMDPDKSTSNYNTIVYVNDVAGEEGIPIEARGMDLDGHGIAMLHNKGMIIDSGKVLVSSINWNENSIMNNREVGIIIEGEAARYYEDVFYSDWGDEPEEHGHGFWPAVASVAALVLVILYFSRRKIKPVVDL